MIKVLGIDPGYTSFAASLISFDEDGGRKHLETYFHKFPPPPNKKLNLKSAFVINIRIEEIFNEIRELIERTFPNAVGIEAYNPIPGRTSSAGKLIAAVTAAKCGIMATGMRPIEFGASDLRHSILGCAKGTKEEIWDAVAKIYPIDAFPPVHKDDVQHLRDSRAIAEVALREVIDREKMVRGSF